MSLQANPNCSTAERSQGHSRDEQLAEYRMRLISRRDRVRAALLGEGNFPEEQFASGGDEADIASTLATGEMRQAIQQAGSEQLATLNDALSRVNESDFGNCADCGEPIPLERLEAIPHAVCCVGCQSKRESAT